MRYGQAVAWLCGGKQPPYDAQIPQEIEYFRAVYAPLQHGTDVQVLHADKPSGKFQCQK